MSRKQKSNVEIVPASEAALVPKPPVANFQAVLDRMVRDRVEEILAEKGGAPLEPYFQTKEIAIELQQRQTVFDRRKWMLYFEKWGCQRCGTKEVGHASKGYCEACHHLIWDRLRRIKRDFEQANPDRETDRQINRLTSRVRSAQALLGEGEK